MTKEAINKPFLSTVRILKAGSCPTVTAKSTLGYQIGCTPESLIQFLVISNSAPGRFNRDWVPLSRVLEIFDEVPSDEPITSFVLSPIFRGKSSNSAPFPRMLIFAPKWVESMRSWVLPLDFSRAKLHASGLKEGTVPENNIQDGAAEALPAVSSQSKPKLIPAAAIIDGKLVLPEGAKSPKWSTWEGLPCKLWQAVSLSFGVEPKLPIWKRMLLTEEVLDRQLQAMRAMTNEKDNSKFVVYLPGHPRESEQARNKMVLVESVARFAVFRKWTIPTEFADWGTPKVIRPSDETRSFGTAQKIMLALWHTKLNGKDPGPAQFKKLEETTEALGMRVSAETIKTHFDNAKQNCSPS